MIEGFVVYSILLMLYLWKKAHADMITRFDFYSAMVGIVIECYLLLTLLTHE